MSRLKDLLIEAVEAGMVPVTNPDGCDGLEHDGEHGLVYLTVETLAGPARLPGLLPEDAEDYIESCGCDNEVGEVMEMIHASPTLYRCFGADGEDSENDYACTNCGHGWRAHNSTFNRTGRRAPCPQCRELVRPTAASQEEYLRGIYG